MTIRTNHPEWFAERDADDDNRLAHIAAADDDADQWVRKRAQRDEAPPVADSTAAPALGDTPTPTRPAATGYFADLSKLTPEHLADYCTGEDDDS